ncbi:fumarylacetoacetate hydrolase family protein [Massilia norwichensis]|jgi:2-keto-4-pentenoate hydratase/2-oxohepta-3-ene-1,7-dioic acid hydratase in catechol pathway|uniref:Fumarylacetoacetate hydrolase family protein n=1 Tax=Massilia norwichensis TaxID=1442366 RepID=A0ABT2A1B6_9BURK|nr:fumarylacetoacetate hydrolase family protein [Massilia norwichensis]MCS0587972.1 fumarylacetoacetate hydrolase family protein [Massilia norwichensis]
MQIATYQLDGRRFVGLVSDDREQVTPFELPGNAAAEGALAIIKLLADGAPLPATAGPAVALASVQLLAPIPVPRRNVWCVGRNYHAHAKELQTSVFKDNDANPDAWPIVFTKVPECVVGPFDKVMLPGAAISGQIDYEAELAVVIGKGGKNIARADAMGHVFGYTVVNDVTARDVQMRHQQWDMGKSFDTFCPMGPWIVTADQLDGTRTRVRCWVNGELRQDGPTENLIFDIPTLIETISRGITLYPGDVIATGTPAGVGLGMKPPRFLAAGDVVRVEIDGIGAIENQFV